MPAISSDVAIGRSMKGLEMFMPSLPSGIASRPRRRPAWPSTAGAGLQLVLPVDDHALAGAEAGYRSRHCRRQLRHGDRPQLDGPSGLMT